jgi:methylphosphotriester-DNA--protein-cysteine methyltransferase
MKEVEEAFKGWLKEKTVAVQDASLATYFRADAEVRLDESKANGPVKKPLGESARVRLDAAKAAYQGFLAEGRCEPEQFYTVSSFWRDAALALAATKPERIGAATEHLARMKTVYTRIKATHDEGRIPTYELWAAEYYVAEAEILLRRAREE